VVLTERDVDRLLDCGDGTRLALLQDLEQRAVAAQGQPPSVG
jgi:hypothetical protein